MGIDFDKIAKLGAAGLSGGNDDAQAAFSRGFYGEDGPPPGAYRKQSGLRKVAAFTPEEQAAEHSYETSDVVRAEFERAIAEEGDPKKRAILEEAYASDFGERPAVPAAEPKPIPGATNPGLKRAEAMARELMAERAALAEQAKQRAAVTREASADHQPTPFQPLTDVSGELERQAAADEAPMSTSVKRGWRQMTDAVANFGDVTAGNDEAVAKRLAAGMEYDYKNPMPSSAQKWKQDWEASNTVGWMTNLSGFIQNNLEQLANSAPAMVGAIPGSIGGAAAGAAIGGPAAPVTALIGGIIGGTIGSAPGSIAIEGGARITEMMARDKVDLGNPVAVQSWLKANRDNIIREGVIKGTTTAAFDGLMGGIGTRIVTGPLLQFQATSAKTLQQMGVNMGDRAAVSAAMQMPAYKAAMAAPARELQAATTTAANAMRGTASFAGEMLGEGGGEYFGEVFATGKGNFDEALLEALMALGTSTITTGTQFAARQFVGGADSQFKAHVAELAAYKPQPDSPLSNAAAAGGAIPGATTTPPPGAPPTEPPDGGGADPSAPTEDPELAALRAAEQQDLDVRRDGLATATQNQRRQDVIDDVYAVNETRPFRDMPDDVLRSTRARVAKDIEKTVSRAGVMSKEQNIALQNLDYEISQRQGFSVVGKPESKPVEPEQKAAEPFTPAGLPIVAPPAPPGGAGGSAPTPSPEPSGEPSAATAPQAAPAASIPKQEPAAPEAKAEATPKKAAGNLTLAVEDTGGGGVTISAYPTDGGPLVGRMVVPGAGVKPDGFRASDIYVGAPARRSGIGTAMADKAEEVLGVPLVGFSGQATGEAKAFLDSRRRAGGTEAEPAANASDKPAAEVKAAAPSPTADPAKPAEPAKPARAAGVTIDDVPPKLLKKLPVTIDRLVGDEVESISVPASEALAEIDDEISAYRKLLACVRAAA